MLFSRKALRLFSVILSFGLGLPAAGLFLTPTALHAQDTETISITLSNLARTYTGSSVALAPDTDITVSPGTTADYTLKITYAGKTAFPKNAGSYAVKVVATTKTAPARSATATGTLVIAKAPLLVSANDQVRLFGVTNPAFTLSYEGFLAGETASVLDRRPVASTLAKATSPAGDYDITVTGGSDNNYDLFGRNAGRLTVIPSFPGTYEALLFDVSSPDLPAGKLSLTLPTQGSAFTGRLELTRLGAVLPLAGKILPDSNLSGATGSASRKTAANDTYRVNFSITADGLSAELFIRENGSSEDIPLYTVPAFSRLADFTNASPCPAAGAYTFVLLNPVNESPVELSPAGLGYATATIAANGTLKLSGNFADGSTLVASALPDSSLRYRLFLRPYGSRADSYAVGEFALQPHPDSARADRYYVPLSDLRGLYWRKAAKPSGARDTLFPDGFGPIDSLIALDPWIPPAKAKAATSSSPASPAVTLAQRLGLATDATTSGLAILDYGSEYLGTSSDDLPSGIEFDPTNKALPILLAPPANPRAWKITALNTANGRFTGSFTLSDSVTGSTKPYVRTVTFQGILRQPPAGDTTLGAGYYLLKPLPDAFDHATHSVDLRILKDE